MNSKARYPIEPATPFEQSYLWQLQRDYFNQAGIDAWRDGEVPHYITSNPQVGRTYAELVLAFLRDLALRGQSNQTVYLVELGAGHGRLCYHFFKHFEKYYEQTAIALPPFCYVLTDFAEDNLEFCADHPRLREYSEKGWLDFALFDAKTSRSLTLKHQGITIEPNSLRQPLMVVANYFFDGIEQDLLRFNQGEVNKCLVALESAIDPQDLSAAGLIKNLQLQLTFEPLGGQNYSVNGSINDLVEFYRQNLNHSHVLIPTVGIDCIERLRRLSRKGVILLTADKGQHHLSELDQKGIPTIAGHGSFSLLVNYHALGHYCQNSGGKALFPLHQQGSLNVGCLLFVDGPGSYVETLSGYERFVQDYGPDDYFTIKKMAEHSIESLKFAEIFAIIRLSGYDAQIFGQMLSRLFDIADTLEQRQKLNLLQLIPRVWDTYYPLKESGDLAADLADLLSALGFYQPALAYYDMSIAIYGEDPDVLCNMGICYCMQAQTDKAMDIFVKLQHNFPLPEQIDILNGLLAQLTEDKVETGPDLN